MSWITSARNKLPGFLSEAYSGRGVEYTGRIGIPDIAIAEEARITTAPSLYSLGAASQIAPDRIERFLDTNWSVISRLFTDHGPWEGFDTKSGTAIKYQDHRPHPCSSSRWHRLCTGQHAALSRSRWIVRQASCHVCGRGRHGFPWHRRCKSFPGPVMAARLKCPRDHNSFRIEGRPLQNGRVTLTVPQTDGVNVSGGELHIRYRAAVPPRICAYYVAKDCVRPLCAAAICQRNICPVWCDAG